MISVFLNLSDMKGAGSLWKFQKDWKMISFFPQFGSTYTDWDEETASFEPKIHLNLQSTFSFLRIYCRFYNSLHYIYKINLHLQKIPPHRSLLTYYPVLSSFIPVSCNAFRWHQSTHKQGHRSFLPLENVQCLSKLLKHTLLMYYFLHFSHP